MMADSLRRYALLWPLLWLGLWYPQCSLAHLPAAYGREFVRVQGQSAPVSTPDVPAANPLHASEASRPYREALREGELGTGPYSATLTEPLVSLARLREEQGEDDEALRLYERAVYVERINSGFESEALVPLLEAQMALYGKQGDVAGLDRVHRQLFRVAGSGLPPYTPERLQAADRYLSWQRQVLQQIPDEAVGGRLLELLDTNRRLLESYLASPEPDPDAHRQLVMSQLFNLYLLQGMDPIAEATTTAVQPGSERNILDSWQRRSVGYGARILEDYIERWPTLPPLWLAAIRLEQGDWYQWNDQRRNARKAYESVERAILAAPEAERPDWLEEPAELPANGAMGEVIPPEQGDAAVTLSFSVSASGQARKVTLVSGPEDTGFRIRRLLRETHFRPAIHMGEAVDSGELERSYWLVE
ncbi:hypothetical protein FV139_10860 [Parahaliea maris]|uniref:Uncharacterized protein n=1 Tax=Parahaliea maris TaxID=2716870 RepID=A0A5C9A018_9GAMM|nr:hypothetical protein [Parahaliea maris]TXS94098.1 hypothetical protein FV139_10860 [Parahaliea maris]